MPTDSRLRERAEAREFFCRACGGVFSKKPRYICLQCSITTYYHCPQCEKEKKHRNHTMLRISSPLFSMDFDHSEYLPADNEVWKMIIVSFSYPKNMPGTLLDKFKVAISLGPSSPPSLLYINPERFRSLNYIFRNQVTRLCDKLPLTLKSDMSLQAYSALPVDIVKHHLLLDNHRCAMRLVQKYNQRSPLQMSHLRRLQSLSRLRRGEGSLRASHVEIVHWEEFLPDPEQSVFFGA